MPSILTIGEISQNKNTGGIVEDTKRRLNILEDTQRDHQREISSLKDSHGGVKLTLDSIKGSLEALRVSYEKHEKDGEGDMVALKNEMTEHREENRAGIDRVIEAMKLIGKQTDGNSSFISKVAFFFSKVVWFGGGIVLASTVIWWLWDKGLIVIMLGGG